MFLVQLVLLCIAFVLVNTQLPLNEAELMYPNTMLPSGVFSVSYMSDYTKCTMDPKDTAFAFLSTNPTTSETCFSTFQLDGTANVTTCPPEIQGATKIACWYLISYNRPTCFTFIPTTKLIVMLDYSGVVVSTKFTNATISNNALFAVTPITSAPRGATVWVADPSTNDLYTFTINTAVDRNMYNVSNTYWYPNYFNATNTPIRAFECQSETTSGSSDTYIASFDGDSNVYIFERTGSSTVFRTSTWAINTTTFTDPSLLYIDYGERYFVSDSTCNCIKVVNGEGKGYRVIERAGVMSFTSHKGKLYVLDGNGLWKYPLTMHASLQVKNITCKGSLSKSSLNIAGGVAPFKARILPDRGYVFGAAGKPSTPPTTNDYPSRAYDTVAPFEIGPSKYSPADVMIFDSILNPNFVGTSEVKVVNVSELNDVPLNTGFAALQVDWRSIGFSYASFNLKCAETDCILFSKFKRLHFAMNPGNVTRSIEIDLGGVSNILRINASQFQVNKWAQFSINFDSITFPTGSSITMRDADKLSGLQSPFYLDDIRLEALPKGSPRTMIVTDACSAVQELDLFVTEENVFEIQTEITPVSCNVAGIDAQKANDGKVRVTPRNAVAPFFYNWIFNSSVNETLTYETFSEYSGLSSLHTQISVYENALNTSWGDGSSGQGRRYLDDSIAPHSEPYCLSFAPALQGTLFSFISPTLLSVNEYPVLEFWVNGGEFGGQRIDVLVYRYTQLVESKTLESLVVDDGIVLPGMWQKARFEIKKTFPGAPYYDRIMFQASEDAQLRIYFDDIVLLSNDALTIKDATGCIARLPVLNIPTPKALTYAETIQNVKCFGVPDGLLMVEVQGGTKPYTYEINNVRTTQSMAKNLPERNVTLEVIDKNGCSVPTLEYSILQPPPMILNLTITPIQCNGGQGNIDATVVGGTPPYVYSWGFSTPLSFARTPVPTSWFSDSPSSENVVTVTGATVECRGTGTHLGLSFYPSHSGYCSLSAGFNATISQIALTCEDDDCQQFSAIEMFMLFSQSELDVPNLQIVLTKTGGGASSSPIPLSSAINGTVTNNAWIKVRVPNSNLGSYDGFEIVSISPTNMGTILVDDIVSIPASGGGIGDSVFPGYSSVVVGVSGLYFLTVVDANGCKFSQNIEFKQPDPIVIEYATKNATSQDIPDGSITLNVTGGVAPYVYEWVDLNMTGPVLEGLQGFESYIVSVTDSNNCTEQITIYVPGNIIVPTDEIVFLKHNRKLAGGMGAVVAAGGAVWIFAVVMFVAFFAAFSPLGSFFCFTLLLGVVTSYLGTITALPSPTDELCIAYPWLMGIAFVLVYGCLFIKAWVIYRVWSRAKEYQKANLTPAYILAVVGAALLIEIVFLIIWTVVDPPKAKWVDVMDNERELQCRSSNVWWIIFLSYKGVWLLFGAVLSVLTRQVVKKYNESSSIGYAIYNNIVLLAIGIPLGVLLGKVAGGRLVIMVVIPVVAFTFTVCIMFFRYWYNVIVPSTLPPVQPSSRTASSTGKKTSGSNTSNSSQSDSAPPSPSISSIPTSKTVELVAL